MGCFGYRATCHYPLCRDGLYCPPLKFLLRYLVIEVIRVTVIFPLLGQNTKTKAPYRREGLTGLVISG